MENVKRLKEELKKYGVKEEEILKKDELLERRNINKVKM